MVGKELRTERRAKGGLCRGSLCSRQRVILMGSYRAWSPCNKASIAVLSGHPCHTLLPACVPAAFVTDILATWELLAADVLGCVTLACFSLGREHRGRGTTVTELHFDVHAKQCSAWLRQRRLCHFVPTIPALAHMCSTFDSPPAGAGCNTAVTNAQH